MRSRKSSARTFLSLLLALVFAIAATPGSMAMPQPKPVDHAMTHAMTAMAHCPDMATQGTPCDHAKPQKEQGNPCKGMAACLGMLSCFGRGAMDVSQFAALPVFAEPAVAITHQAVTGLTLRPDNPPPIA